jgi:hypothetical protein
MPMEEALQRYKDECAAGKICAFCGQSLTPEAKKTPFTPPIAGNSLTYYSCQKPVCQSALKKLPKWQSIKAGPLYLIMRHIAEITSWT